MPIHTRRMGSVYGAWIYGTYPFHLREKEEKQSAHR
jgi:hypothetical protein